jgi:rare lipoprotein A
MSLKRWVMMPGLILILGGCAPDFGPLRQLHRVDYDAAPVSTERGIASWYGPGFHGHATASGELYNQDDTTAAHPTLPLGTIVEVVNLTNRRRVMVEITDRGPFAKDRIIDLSRRAAEMLDMIGPGSAPVEVRVLRVK